MLLSPSTAVAFAHYPKTAGTSLSAWFVSALPDAREVVPGNPHVFVRDALRMAGLLRRGSSTIVERVRDKVVREAGRLVTGRPTPEPERPVRSDTRIIGVIREPFEMLVSLYEFWRRHPFAEEPTIPLIRTARTGTFRQFLAMAVDERVFPDYTRFFDVGGPLWRNTILLDFASLGPALLEACTRLNIARPRSLGMLNAAPARSRDLGVYLADAGPLVFRVRSYFGWYYDEGVRLMLRGDRAAHACAA